VAVWACTVAERPLSPGLVTQAAAYDHLRSGVVLCDLVNRIRPGIVPRVEEPRGPFPQRENIARFIAAARMLGVQSHELFETGDLFAGTGMRQVAVCLGALGRACWHVRGYLGPCYGKPDLAKLGAHRRSSFSVHANEGLWGKAAGQYRPVQPLRKSLSASATGFMRAGVGAGPSTPPPFPTPTKFMM